MQRRFDEILKGLCPSGEGDVLSHPLLAVSGGVDSMSMAYFFLHSSLGIRFAVANCNFHLRSDESDADSAMVRSWCESHGIVCHTADFETTRYAQFKGISIEMAARELRYEWFDSLCREYDYSSLAVAHNLNDNAETLMLNMLRGTGLKGMTGMQTLSVLPLEGSKVRLVRPLLGFSRSEIEQYACKNGVPSREDSTNSQNEYRRNKLRNQVFPLFREINPSFLEAFSKDMANLSQIALIADSYFASARSSAVLFEDADTLRLDVSSLRNDSNAAYLLYRLLDPYGFNSSDISSLASLLSSTGTFSGKQFFSGSWRLLTSASEITVSRQPDACGLRGFPQDNSLIVRCDGEYELDGIRFSVRTVNKSPELSPKQPQGVSMMDAQACPFPFLVRRWRNGDWMKPIGLHGRKKLSDMFVDLKMSLSDKEKSLVAVVPGMNGDSESVRVASLLGRRVDESVKVQDSSEDVVIVSILL